MLNISRDKIYYLLRTRQLRSIKIGKSRRMKEFPCREDRLAGGRLVPSRLGR
jgi:hypothetical protein